MIGNWLRQLDSRVASDALARETAARDAGIRKQRAGIMFGSPSEVARTIGGQQGWTEQRVAGVEQGINQGGRQYRRTLADEFAPQMNRGPMGIGQMGMTERANNLIANNVYVRRGALPAAVAGGGVLAGAALTEGAQQLMALMGFMQQGAEQEQRAQTSPLVG